jgi:hypothetical protein
MALAIPLPGTGPAPTRPARHPARPRRVPGRAWWLRLATTRNRVARPERGGRR